MRLFPLPKWLRIWGAKPSRPTVKTAQRCLPFLEVLEDRTVPTTFSVVPASTLADALHFHDLTSAIAAAFITGDVIQIEPGSVPGSGATGAKILTIQGDPMASPSSLPQILTLSLESSGNVLTNLNVNAVGIANGAKGQTIKNSLIATINEQPGALLNGNNFIAYNTISFSITLGSGGSGNPGANHDVILDNVFTGTNGFIPLLVVAHVNGAVIQGNTLTDSIGGVIGIQVEESTGVLVANNIIVLSGTTNKGIVIDNPEFDVAVNVTNNRVETAGLGTGIQTNKIAAHGLSVLLSGNYLGMNKIGLDVEGDGGSLGTVDAGGGVLFSVGGNDFHGFVSTIGGVFAIQTGNGGGTVSAQHNIFSVNGPGSVTNPQGGGIDVGAPLSPDQSFVQDLYNDMLGRSGSLGEINGWVSLLPTMNRNGVASAIVHSKESCYRVVDRLFVKLLGREALSSETVVWGDLLVGGVTEEQLIAGLSNTPDFAARAPMVAPTPSDTNTDFVEALYVLLLARTPSTGEVNGWVGSLSALGRQGVTNGFVTSLEFRTKAVQCLYFTNASLLGVPVFDTLPNMLHRSTAPGAGEVAGWANSSIDLLNLESAFGGSDEFYSNG
jgi:hypothetical protein